VIPAQRPLAGFRFALVGAGAVGGALAAWMATRGARLVAVAAREGSRRARSLAEALDAALVGLDQLDSAGADLLLLAVPDTALSAAASALASRSQAGVALHVAGALPASAIAPLARRGTAIGGFHPLRAFAGSRPAPGDEPPAGTFFALGGDPAAVAAGARIAAALGGTSAVVTDSARPIYHLAATLLAGGITTLAATAFELRRRAALPEEAEPGFARLAQDALAGALAADDPADGITGPAARGDLETFAAEARALARIAPEALPIVLDLARESLRQRHRKTSETPAQRRLAEALRNADLLDLPKDRVLTSGPEPHG
jgi:predicted short-subunit dehydrogenase-like oxidoreductase (DUF2520 family)